MHLHSLLVIIRICTQVGKKKSYFKLCCVHASKQYWLTRQKSSSPEFHAHAHTDTPSLGLSCRLPSTGNYFHPQTVTRNCYPWGWQTRTPTYTQAHTRYQPAECRFWASACVALVLTLVLIPSYTVAILLNAPQWLRGHWSLPDHGGHTYKDVHTHTHLHHFTRTKLLVP